MQNVPLKQAIGFEVSVAWAQPDGAVGEDGAAPGTKKHRAFLARCLRKIYRIKKDINSF